MMILQLGKLQILLQSILGCKILLMPKMGISKIFLSKT